MATMSTCRTEYSLSFPLVSQSLRVGGAEKKLFTIDRWSFLSQTRLGQTPLAPHAH
jgi:hypothetical protein